MASGAGPVIGGVAGAATAGGVEAVAGEEMASAW